MKRDVAKKLISLGLTITMIIPSAVVFAENGTDEELILTEFQSPEIPINAVPIGASEEPAEDEAEADAEPQMPADSGIFSEYIKNSVLSLFSDTPTQTPEPTEPPTQTPEATLPPLLSDESGTCGDNVIWTLSVDGTLTISGSGEMTEATWQDYLPYIKKVVVEEGVESIAASAFSECSNLVEATLPSSVTKIGRRAFRLCSSLEKVNIPENVEELDVLTFYDCTSLKNITLPQNLKTIGNTAFRGCSLLSEIEVPSSVTLIDTGAFYGCGALESINLPEGLQTLGSSAFGYCSSLTDIAIPSKLESIGATAFYACNKLTEIALPDGITNIGNGTFWECTNLKSVHMPENLKTIEQSAFGNCSSLVNVTLPEGVESIANGAFSGCTSLKSINLPDGITSIGNGAFWNCASLETVDIPESITVIEETLFSRCTNLKSVTIPSGITSIGNAAFWYCENLTEINLPDGITSMGDEVFNGCSNLQSIKLPKGITSIGDYMFVRCSSLKTAELPEGLTTIGKELFWGCESLTNVVIPNGVTSIGDFAFYGCTSLRSIKLPDGLTSIGQEMFVDCKSLTDINIPSSVTSIANYAFVRCESLQILNLPDGITSVGDELFWGCKSLEEVYIPRGVKKITERMFACCESLKSIVIPDTVEYIDFDAFWDCKNMTAANIPDSVVGIGSGVFQGCASLTEIIIPDTVASIGENAFGNCNKLLMYVYPGTYAEDYAEQNKLNYELMQFADKSVTLNILDENGRSLKSGYAVNWYRDGDSDIIASGNKLVLNSSDSYEYEIILNSELGQIYKQPQKTDLTITDGSVDVVLEKIPDVRLTGKVRDENNNLLSNCNVELEQTCNGKYTKKLTVTTNANGIFYADILSAPTKVTVSEKGFYSFVKTAVEYDNTETLIDMGNITLKALPANKITVSVSVIPAKADTEVVSPSDAKSFDGMTFKLYNKTKNKEITDFYVEYPNIIPGGGEASGGDVLELSILSSEYSADTVAVTLDENKIGSAKLNLVQNGKISIEGIRGSGKTNVILYNSDGDRIESYEANDRMMTSSLPDNTYTVVFINKTSFIKDVDKFSKLADIGLKEGTDYHVECVNVQSGKITVLSNVEVPRLDESKLRYTIDNQTFFTSNYNSAITGKYVTLRASYEIDERYASDGEYVSISIPGDMILLDGSVSVDGKKVPYSVDSDGSAVIKTNSPKGVILCYVTGKHAGEYSVNAYLGFRSKGMTLEQIIGNVKLEIEDSKIVIPAKTSSKTVIARGSATPNSRVTIYDNGEKAGETVTNSNGSWSAEINLVKPYAFSYHMINALIENEKFGISYETESKNLVYDESLCELKKITMYNTAHPNGSLKPTEYATVIDFTEQQSGRLSYKFWPDYPVFSFKVEIETANPEHIPEMYVITNNYYGGKSNVKCSYDKKSGMWIGSYRYPDGDAPVSVSASYRVENAVHAVYSPEEAKDTCNSVELAFDMIDDYVENDLELEAEDADNNFVIMSLVDGQTSQKLGYASLIYFDYSKLDLNKTPMSPLGEGPDNTQYYTCGRVDSENVIVLIADTREKALIGYMIQSPEKSSSQEVSLFASVSDMVDIAKDVIEEVNGQDILESAIESVGSIAIDGTSQNIDIGKVMYDAVYENAPGAKEVLEAIGFFQMQSRVNDIYQEMSQYGPQLRQIIDVKCEDGSFKLSDSDRNRANLALNTWETGLEEGVSRMRERLEAMRIYIIASCAAQIRDMAFNKVLEKCTGTTKVKNPRNGKLYDSYNLSTRFFNDLNINSKDGKKIRDAIMNFNDALEFADDVSNDFEDMKDLWDDIANITGNPSSDEIWNNLYGTIPEDIRNGIEDISSMLQDPELALEAQTTRNVINGTEDNIRKQLDQIRQFINSCPQNCKKKEEEEPPLGDGGGLSADMGIEWDPSGFVCEAVESNRIEGVTASAYYFGDVLDEFGGPTGEKSEFFWNAQEYDQLNPLITDEGGAYSWDVPEGKWIIRFSKDGYHDADSSNDPEAVDGYLNVPPPQTEVNAAMVSKEAPRVKSVNAYEDGIRIEFTQYMDMSSVNTDNVTVTASGGAVSGRIEPLNAETSFNDKNIEYASMFMFVPDSNINGIVRVGIKNVVNYAKTAIKANYVSEHEVYVQPKSISVSETEEIEYNGGALVNVQILPPEAGANKTITVNAATPNIVSAGEDKIITDKNGLATLMINGELPGEGVIEFSLDGTDLSAATRVSVGDVEPFSDQRCEKVTASKSSGKLLKGTKVTLSTETEGAEIYYTLDKTCPCVTDSPSRIKYTGPIEVNENMYIIAYAVKDGYEDSPTAGFSYTLSEYSCALKYENGQLKLTSFEPVSGILIMANYTEDNKLISTYTEKVENVTDQTIILTADSGSYTRIMFWDSMNTMKPLCEKWIEKIIPAKCTRITAEYKADGSLDKIVSIDEIDISEIEEVSNTPTRKTFYWNSLSAMKPMTYIAE